MQKDPTPHAGGAAQARSYLLGDMAWHCTPCHTSNPCPGFLQALQNSHRGGGLQLRRCWRKLGQLHPCWRSAAPARVWGLGLRFWCSGLRVWGLGLRVWRLGLRVWDSGVLCVKKRVRVTELNRSGCQSNR